MNLGGRKVLFLALMGMAAKTAIAQEADSSIEEILVLGEEFSSVSEGASRLGLSLREIPATVDTIDGDAIRQRQDISLLEAVTRSAGFTGAGNPGNGGTSIAARGFSGQDAVTKLYDGNHYFTMAGTITFPFDTWAVERVEILKGPASVLYGQGGVAGAYNVIPKRPSEEFDLDLRFSVGQDSTNFLGASINGALVEGVNGRIDYSRFESDNWIENGESDSEMIAIALEWEAAENLKFSLRHDAGDQSPIRYFGIPVVDGEFNEDWVEANLSPSDTQINYEDQISRLSADWIISASASFNAELFSLETDRYWQTAETYFYDSVSDSFSRWDPLIIGHDMSQEGARANFVFDTELGDMPWKSSIGAEATHVSLNYISNFNSTHPDSVDWGGDTDTVDLNDFDAGSWSDLSDSVAALDQVSDADQVAIFAETQLRVTGQLALVAGLRYDEIETDYERLTYDSTGVRDTSVDNSVTQKIDPMMFRFGAVYDLNPATAFYGQVSTGETHPRGGDIVRVSNSYREADTVTHEQFEVGVKQSLYDNRINWSLALFDITKKDLVIDDPDSSDPTDFISVPEQSSQGVEVSVDFVASDNIATYLNAVVLDAERDTGDGFVPTDYVPEVSMNAGLLYSLNEQIRFGADVRYVDERPYSGGADLPSHTLVDLSLGWAVNEYVRATINLTNVTDELYFTSDHWAGEQWSVGRPRFLGLTLDVGI